MDVGVDRDLITEYAIVIFLFKVVQNKKRKAKYKIGMETHV